MSSNMSGGVTQLVAGAGATVTPASGTGRVTVSAGGGGGGNPIAGLSGQVLNTTGNTYVGLGSIVTTNGASSFLAVTDPGLGVGVLQLVNYAVAGTRYRFGVAVSFAVNTAPTAAGIVEARLQASDGGGVLQDFGGVAIRVGVGSTASFYLSGSVGMYLPNSASFMRNVALLIPPFPTTMASDVIVDFWAEEVAGMA